jgi:hypothetical protein
MKPVPFTEIPADGKLTKDVIEKVLDLDNWSVQEFFTGIDNIICPHCKFSHGPRKVTEESGSRILQCGRCKGILEVSVVDTPLGKAWQTRKAEEQ